MFNTIRSAFIFFSLLGIITSPFATADAQLNALANEITSLQQQRNDNQIKIKQLQQALQSAKASQTPYQRKLAKKLAALKKAKQAAGNAPDSYAQAEINNAKFKAALAQRKFDQAKQKIEQINDKIKQLKQQQADSKNKEEQLDKRILARKEDMQRQVQRQKQLLKQKARKAKEDTLAAKKAAEAATKKQSLKTKTKPAQVKAKTKKPQKPSVQPIDIALYYKTPQDETKAKRLSRHFAWLQQQKQRNTPESKTVTLNDHLTLLNGDIKKQSITLSLHANKNYAGKLTLVAGKHILRLGNSKWTILVPKNLEQQTYFFIVDYHDETLPDLHWYHTAMQ